MDKNRLGKLFGVTIQRKMGEGGGSNCYLASVRKTNEIVLLKHVAIETEKDVRWMEQLENEFEIAKTLAHPNIRSAVDLQFHPNRRAATDAAALLQFIDGMEMDEWARQNDPPLEDLLAIFVKCADALNHMHLHNHAHADMKPTNVLIDSRDGEPRIIDLGQACHLNHAKERVQGTPGFIAPEQVKRREVTYLTDVFNWGATMYFMLSGTKVDTEKFSEPEPLSGCPRDLADLVQQCLRPEPMQRPQSMKYVRDRLQRIASELRDEGQNESAA